MSIISFIDFYVDFIIDNRNCASKRVAGSFVITEFYICVVVASLLTRELCMCWCLTVFWFLIREWRWDLALWELFGHDRLPTERDCTSTNHCDLPFGIPGGCRSESSWFEPQCCLRSCRDSTWKSCLSDCEFMHATSSNRREKCVPRLLIQQNRNSMPAEAQVGPPWNHLCRRCCCIAAINVLDRPRQPAQNLEYKTQLPNILNIT